MADMRIEADGNYYFGEIKIWNDSNRRQTIGIVVEAKNDESFYKKFLIKDCTFFCYNGREKAISTMKEVASHSIDFVYGLLDSDFDRLAAPETPPPNIVFSDCHDIEMMMVRSQAWDNVLELYAATTVPKNGGQSQLDEFEGITGASILETLMSLSAEIGILRLFNQLNDCGLRFKTFHKGKYKTLDYSSFVKKETLEIDWDKLIKTVENKSQAQGYFANNSDDLSALEEMRDHDHDLYELCNGHDFMHLFSLALEKAISNRSSSNKVAEKDLFQTFVSSYRIKDFKRTAMYASLLSIQNNFPQGRSLLRS